MKKTKLTSLYFVAGAFLLSLAYGADKAHATIDTDLGVGSRGNEVTELQQFLSGSPSIYPERLVTGYFGTLTRDAVEQFQIHYEIPSVGRVGPLTRARINSLMTTGLDLDVTVPVISANSPDSDNNGSSISVTTNEPATVQVFYDTKPLVINEITSMRNIPLISGLFTTPSTMGTSHEIEINNLTADTDYHYVIRAIDRSGNISLTLPSTLQTD